MPSTIVRIARVTEAFALTRMLEMSPRLDPAERYSLNDFLQFHDESFVRNAYHGILRRDPDGPGYSSFLQALREGRLSKTEILGRMRFSREGRAMGVTVSGLPLAFAMRSLRRVPVLGRLAGIGQYIIRLPDIVRSHERLEAAVFHRELQIKQHINLVEAQTENGMHRLHHQGRDTDNRLAVTQGELVSLAARVAADLAAVDTRLASIAADVDALRADLNASVTANEDHMRATKADRAKTESVMTVLAGQIREVHAKTEMSDQAVGARFTHMERVLTGQIDGVDAHAKRALLQLQSHHDELDRMSGELTELRVDFRVHQSRVVPMLATTDVGTGPKPRLDAAYVDFENRFRGTIEDIKSRVAIYLPDVQRAKAGTPQAPLVDLGSGRGEWLQLLKEQGFTARGVDVNGVMVKICREQGLEVIESDAIHFLAAVATDSLGALTAMHVVEHIPFAQLMLLVNESYRALRPGGLLILETPNPENVVVGACGFYIDPTHQRPLPPATLRFVAEAFGFERVEIRRLHPSSAGPMLPDGSRALPEDVHALLYGPQDYAIVAYKPDSAIGQLDSGST